MFARELIAIKREGRLAGNHATHQVELDGARRIVDIAIVVAVVRVQRGRFNGLWRGYVRSALPTNTGSACNQSQEKWQTVGARHRYSMRQEIFVSNRRASSGG